MAVRDVAGIKTIASSRFADNATGQISAGDSSDTFSDVADSFLNITDHLLDEDDMASDSATKVPSQQSVKAFVTGDLVSNSFKAIDTLGITTSDAAFMADRIMIAGAGNGYGFSDFTNFRRPTYSYIAFNADYNVGLGTSDDYNHVIAFKDNLNYSGTGLISNIYSFVSGVNTTAAGAVTTLYGFYMDDATGPATITNQYGLYIAELLEAANNFGVYTAGSTKSYFGGNVGIGTETPHAPLQFVTSANARKIVLYEVADNDHEVSAIGIGSMGEFLFQTPETDRDYVWSAGTSSSTSNELMRLTGTGNLGIGVTPTAVLHLKAGTATANTAPLKLTTGTALTVSEDGAIEYHSSHLYFTIGSTRYQLDQQATNVISGTFSPTFTSETNLDSTPVSTALTSKYTRVGDMVTVTMYANVDPTASGAYSFFATLPVASNLAAATDLLGIGSSGTADGHRCEVVADITNDRAHIKGTSSGTATGSLYLTYTYKVI